MQRGRPGPNALSHAMTGRRLALVAVLLLLLIGPPGRAVAAEAPAEAAEQVRSQLVQAQLALVDDPAGAAAAFAVAQTAYTTQLAEGLAQAAPDANARAAAGFAAARQALTRADSPAFAAARAQIWTALLAGAISAVEQAVQRGDTAAARDWLALREFRRTTGTVRPGTDATLALADWRAGTIRPTEALAAVQADLLDTYQSRLAEALDDLAAQAGGGYPARRAESAALAEGYFLILAPTYRAQQGAAARAAAAQTFTRLSAAGISGQDLPAALTAAQQALQAFRATPFSPAQQVIRAGQLLGFLAQVPVEYTRGVRNGQIVVDLELQEAISFRAGAAAAFNDLQALLAARDAAKTAQIAAELTTLQQQLAPATGPATAPETVRASVERITALLGAIMPPEWQQPGAADFDVIGQMLDQMEAAAGSGQYDRAEAARLDAASALETGIRGRLLLLAPDRVPELADRFAAGDGLQPGLAALIRAHAPADTIHRARTRLDQQLITARIPLTDPHDPAQVQMEAAFMVFRAGLLPFVLLATLLASRRRGLPGRWIGALGSGLIAGLIIIGGTGLLPAEALAELVRYAAPLRAGAALLTAALWLGLLIGFFRPRISRATDAPPQPGRGWPGVLIGAGGLALLGLVGIYSRGFDAVLALRSLTAAPDQEAAATGLVGGIVGILLVGGGIWAVLARLTPRRARLVSALLLGAALLVLAGDSIYWLEAAGWLPIHAVGLDALPAWTGRWLGLYPRWEGIGGQLAVVLLAAGLYWRARRHPTPVAPAEVLSGLGRLDQR